MTADIDPVKIAHVDQVRGAATTPLDRLIMILDGMMHWLEYGRPVARSDVERAQECARAMAGGVRVKPLVWHESHMSSWNDDWHTVPTGYTIRCADENGWKWQGLGGHGYEYSATSAKAAAQADYERRILSALEPGAQEGSHQVAQAGDMMGDAMPSHTPAAGALEERAWLDLVEKEDRTSPAEYPNHALITRDELAIYMAWATDEALAYVVHHTPAPEADAALVERINNQHQCPDCAGRGRFETGEMENGCGGWGFQSVDCSTCQGTGIGQTDDDLISRGLVLATLDECRTDLRRNHLDRRDPYDVLSHLEGYVKAMDASRIGSDAAEAERDALKAEVTRLADRNAEHEARFTAESSRADHYKARAETAESSLAAARGEVERLTDLLCLADEALMDSHGCFPLDRTNPTQIKLNDACLAIRAVTGADFSERKRRARATLGSGKGG